MWALYADGDRGFCVGFNTEKLLERFADLDEPSVSMDNVCYFKKGPPCLNVYKMGDEALKQVPLIKSARWTFEKEIRLVLYKDTDKRFILKEESFSTVILGSKMSQPHINRIKRILGGWQYKPQLFVREHVPKSFGFTTREISY